MIALPGPDAVVLAIGEPLIELSSLDTAAGACRLGFAGDTLNTAIYLARSLAGRGPRVEYLTALGTDSLSDAMIARMEDEGIGTGRILRDPDRLPGLYAIEVDAAGERSFLYWRATSAAKAMFDSVAPAEALAGADVIYLSGITLAILPPDTRDALIAACAEAKAEGHIVAFDSNHRPRLWESPEAARDACRRMWRATSLAFPSADDEAALHPGETADGTLDRLSELGVSEIALKRGADGPLLWHDDRRTDPTLPPARDVVDTTAAGDSFNAGYLAERLTGATPARAAEAGHALACRVIAHPGAILPREA